jgi:hypothetical protein
MMEFSSPEDLFDSEFKNRMVPIAENGNTVAALFDCVFSKPFKATSSNKKMFGGGVPRSSGHARLRRIT